MCFSMLSVSKHIVTYYKNTHINSFENMIKYTYNCYKGQGSGKKPQTKPTNTQYTT